MLDRTKYIGRDQSGVALVIALVMMVVLTLIGLASTLSSTYEMKLSGNKRGATGAFYTADSGIQAVVANVGNFNVPGNFVSVNPATLPSDLQIESIDSKFTSPSLSLPVGVNFTDPPQTTVFHTTRTSAPRGLGLSATGNYEFEHFVIDSIGRDQMEISLLKSNCEIRERVVRLIPTLQGGN